MCLLIVLAHENAEFPLAVAANRDELFERPATAMTVLRESSPRVLGGRDELARGTWLAVNEFGVVAGLTNRPATTGKDPTKRSRGELPIALASYRSARAAVEAFASEFRPYDYNPSWLLVGDRDDLFAVDMTGDELPAVRRLPPGVHIMENHPLAAGSPKVDHVRSLLGEAGSLSGPTLVGHLQAVLADHEVPPVPPDDAEVGEDIPAVVRAACVHGERYGTRWSGVITVQSDPEDKPAIRYCDGAACRAAYVDAGPLWSGVAT